MLLRHRVRDLVLASWEVDPASVAAVLPAGLTAAPVDGRHLVTVAAMRWEHARLAGIPVPRFSQLNVRVYAEGGVVFLAMRVTPAGMGGALLGFPVRPARLRVRRGLVDALGLGVHIAYESQGPAEPSELTAHDVGLVEAAGVRAFSVRRGEAEWRHAEPTGAVRAEPLAALGFSVGGAPSMLYAERASFEAELPAKRLP
ncbi:MAG TPA: DUF2071 domain-containing protein [Gaiellaceae bacterium]